MPLQQHLSISLFVFLHSNFPFFCFSQQHVFISLPVKVQTSLGEAANVAAEASIIAISMANHLLVLVIVRFLSC
jgi:hypothetical protein